MSEAMKVGEEGCSEGVSCCGGVQNGVVIQDGGVYLGHALHMDVHLSRNQPTPFLPHLQQHLQIRVFVHQLFPNQSVLLALTTKIPY